MLNHFRTLLLNLPFTQEKDHIPEGFYGVKLPDGLQAVYDVLFPPNSSRYFKLFLAQNYLNIINGAGMSADVKAFDNRISYDLTNEEFFKINRFSNPKISNSKFPLFVSGKLTSVKTNNYFYDAFLIRQVSNTNQVTIYSRVNGNYIKGTSTYLDPSSAGITLDFSNVTVSAAVDIGTTGISFIIGAGETFTSTSDKTWEFVVEAPYEFEFEAIMDRILALDPFKIFRKYDLDLTKFENLWNLHYNPVYKFSAFLLAYVTVVNSL